MVRSIKQQTLFEVAEVQLIYKSKVKASMRPKITCPGDIYEILSLHWDIGQIELKEQMKLMLLNRAFKVLGILEVASGGITNLSPDPRLIFSAALKANATNIVLAHNHPSGNLEPSKSDIEVTTRIKEIGQLHEIKLLDHLIISNEGYLSFAEQGLL